MHFHEHHYFYKPAITPPEFGVIFYDENTKTLEHTQNSVLNLFTDNHVWHIDSIQDTENVAHPSIDSIWELIRDENFSWWYKYNFVLYAQNFATFFRDEYIIGSGIDRESDKAKIKAIAEWYERYSSGGLRKDEYISTEKHNIDEQLFNDIYWGASEIVNNDIQAIPAYEVLDILHNEIIINKTPSLLPKESALYLLDHKNITIFNNSNGIASHQNLYQAFLHAYYEILERDSIALIWYYKLQTPKIVFSAQEQEVIFWEQYFDENFFYEFYDIRLDKTLPHILCIARNKHWDFPYFFASASVKENIDDALRKSHDEIANMILTFTVHRKKYHSIMEEKNNQLPWNTLEHLIYYTNPKNKEKIEFLWKHNNTTRYSSLKNQSIYNPHPLDEKDLYITNLTTRLWEKMWIFTVKCFSRKYIPFWFGNITFPKEKILQRWNKILDFLCKKWIYNHEVFEQYHWWKHEEYAHFFG